MEVNDLISEIQTLGRPKQFNEYNLLKLDENIYYGIDKNDCISFLVESTIPNVYPVIQETKYLSFSFNIIAKIIINGESINKRVHILTCTSKSSSDIKAFISLTEAFKNSIKENNPFIINELFSSLKTYLKI